MFVQEYFYQEEPDVVASFMTELSLKSGLRAWWDKSYTVVQSEMKLLYFTQMESQGVLKPDAHMFVQEDFYQEESDVVA